jgi:hypothetical protein
MWNHQQAVQIEGGTLRRDHAEGGSVIVSALDPGSGTVRACGQPQCWRLAASLANLTPSRRLRPLPGFRRVVGALAVGWR